MLIISIDSELKSRCPQLRLGCIVADVQVAESDRALLAEINERLEQLRQSLRIEEISSIPAITASRKAYRACGKDPARYRLSAEALLRRIVSGKGLYQINNVVDQLNLVSVISGFSIGGYDADKIKGDICFGIGKENEPYEGIGRGELNIENLPVFRDQEGAFGTPTSDSQRTEVSNDTRKFLMILIDFDRNSELEKAKLMAIQLLREHCGGSNIKEYNIGDY
ncbi:MAG TPA: phenylalanine--tRNA ligase beta subunit-related protein [Prolixibacteraceae bacterium]|nr:phenylalanine--tRNA ligase beta subunit-related protein [Prolixibacteraceae bacterium]